LIYYFFSISEGYDDLTVTCGTFPLHKIGSDPYINENTGFIYDISKFKFVLLILKSNTVTSIAVGSSYFFGSLFQIPLCNKINFIGNRADTGRACFTVTVEFNQSNANANLTLNAQDTIPSGVELCANVSYFYYYK